MSTPTGMPSDPGRGTLILVLGILGLVVCGFLAPVAWIMGASDLKKIAAGHISPEAKGTTQAGMICGIIGSVLMILACCIGIGVAIVMIFAAAAAH